MNIIYKRLFNLKIGHSYSSDGLAKGIKVCPTSTTAQLLNNGRMLFKVTPTGITVLYRAQDDETETTPLVDMGKDLKLTFYLTVEDQAQFFNVTDLDESTTKKFQSSNIAYFKNDPSSASTNSNSPEPLVYSIIDTLKDQLFTYQYQHTGGPSEVLIRVTNESGGLVSVGKSTDGTPYPTTLTITKDSNDNYSQQIDLRDKKTGKYTITIHDSIDDTIILQTETIYADKELSPKQILGIVDVVYETATGHSYEATEEYLLQFLRRETIWKYFIVDKNGKVDLFANDLFITDEGGGSGDPYDVNSFSRDGSEPHLDVRINDFDTVIFKSDLPIPFFEVPKLSLELRKNPGDKKEILHLPNPSHSGVIKSDLDDLVSEIYVFI